MAFLLTQPVVKYRAEADRNRTQTLDKPQLLNHTPAFSVRENFGRFQVEGSRYNFDTKHRRNKMMPLSQVYLMNFDNATQAYLPGINTQMPQRIPRHFKDI